MFLDSAVKIDKFADSSFCVSNVLRCANLDEKPSKCDVIRGIKVSLNTEKGTIIAQKNNKTPYFSPIVEDNICRIHSFKLYR